MKTGEYNPTTLFRCEVIQTAGSSESWQDMNNNTNQDQDVAFKRFSFSGNKYSHLPPSINQQTQPINPQPQDPSLYVVNNSVPYKGPTGSQVSPLSNHLSSSSYFSYPPPSFTSDGLIPQYIGSSQESFGYQTQQLLMLQSQNQLPFRVSELRFPTGQTAKDSTIPASNDVHESIGGNQDGFYLAEQARSNPSSGHTMLKYRGPLLQVPPDQFPITYQRPPIPNINHLHVSEPLSENNMIQNPYPCLSELDHLKIENNQYNKPSVDYNSPVIPLQQLYPQAILMSQSSTAPESLPPLQEHSSEKRADAIQVIPEVIPTVDNKFIIQPMRKRRNKGDPPLKYGCPYCPKVYDKLNNLKSHLTSHSSARPYICTTCKRGFARNYDCKRHQLLHEKAKDRN